MRIFTNKTEVFLAKKSGIVALILAGLSAAVFGINTEILTGLMVGYLVTLIRLRVLALTVENLITNAVKQIKRSSPARYILMQLFTVMVLLLAVMKSTPFFLAVFTGILVIPITILINSLTELTGITKNNFE